MVGGGDPLYLKFWVNRPPLEQIRRFSTDNRSYSASAVTPGEKVQLTLTGSLPRAFKWSQDGHHTLSLSPIAWLENAKLEVQLSNEPKMIVVRCP